LTGSGEEFAMADVQPPPDESRLNLDEEGFLKSLAVWDKPTVERLARLNQIGPLTDEHWKVLGFVRDYYLEHGIGPPVVKIGKATGLSAAAVCQLFPCGVVRGAYRLAGLPRPPGCS
jgi:tRNA 2-thiouridine synthesizing protein E